MRVEHGLLGCGGLVTLVGLALIGWVALTWPEAPEGPPLVRLGEQDLPGGSHRLGPYPLGPGRAITMDLAGTITCRRFHHEPGSLVHRGAPRLMILGIARDAAGRQVGRGDATIGQGSCSGELSVPADQTETTLPCRQRLVVAGDMADQVTVDLMLPATNAPHQDAVQQMHVIVYSSRPGDPRGRSVLWSLVSASCTTPLGLVLLGAGVLVLVLRKKRAQRPPR